MASDPKLPRITRKRIDDAYMKWMPWARDSSPTNSVYPRDAWMQGALWAIRETQAVLDGKKVRRGK